LKDETVLGILLGPPHPVDDTTFFRNVQNSLSADMAFNIPEDNQSLSNFVFNKRLLAERLSVN